MIKNQIENELKKVLESLGIEGVEPKVEYPADPKHGDYASNVAMAVFGKGAASAKASASQRKNPMELAEEIRNVILSHAKDLPGLPAGRDSSSAGRRTQNDIFDRVEVVKPGFVNFFLEDKFFVQKLQNSDTEDRSAEEREKKGKVVVEYSSPNIAKPFTIGHLRSSVIGDAVANLLEMVGFDVIRDNHVGDWGTQFGKLIYAIKTWGNEAEIASSARPVKLLVELYVRFHEEADRDPKLEDEARAWFKKLESGDEEARELWHKCIDWSWIEFDEIYKKLGVPSRGEFVNDGRGYGESYFEDRMQPVVDELEEKGLLKTGKEGARVVEFADITKLPPLMILKKDGATLYATRDLATDKFRLEKYGRDVRIINEVGTEQELYFRQLYKLEEMLGWFDPSQRVNLKHGLIRFKEGKMSTRKGNTIWLEDVLKEAEDRAFKLANEAVNYEGSSSPWQENPWLERRKKLTKERFRVNEEESLKADETRRQIAIGAIKWNDLKRDPKQDISFDWDEILNMQGNSGPYVQYAFARTQSVLAKQATENLELRTKKDLRFEIGNLKLETEERELLRLLVRYDEVVFEAAEKLAPNTLCTYLFELAQAFNLFYQKHQIINANSSERRDFRLFLTQKTGITLKKGLSILGINSPVKM